MPPKKRKPTANPQKPSQTPTGPYTQPTPPPPLVGVTVPAPATVCARPLATVNC